MTNADSLDLLEQSRSLPKRPSAYGWVVTIVVWLTGVAMPLNMLKVSILAPALMEVFKVGTDAMSWVMAMFYIVGALLAIPGAFIVKRIGHRLTFVVSLICALVGGVLGYVATDLSLFIVSRVVEGIGFGLVGTAAIPAISLWFPPKKRGVPLGIWAIYVTMAFLVGPRLFSGIFTSTSTLISVMAIVGLLIISLSIFKVLMPPAMDPVKSNSFQFAIRHIRSEVCVLLIASGGLTTRAF